MMNKQTKRHFFADMIVKLLCLIPIVGFTAACGKAVVITNVPGPTFSPRIIAYLIGEYGKISPDGIPAHMLTHINYAFANLKDGKMVTGYENDDKNLEILGSLRQKNRDIKLIISVGGWIWSGGFSDMAFTRESRQTFINSAVDFLSKYNLDGIDIDWEYPGLPGYGNPHRPEDKQNFTFLLRELREQLDLLGKEHNKKYVLSIAAAATDDYLEHIETDKFHLHLDYINLMSYDYAGEWESVTGHHTNLYVSGLRPAGISTAKVVTAYLNAGIPKEKIVLGAAFYGRSWKDVNKKNRGLFQPGTPASGNFSYKTLHEKYIDKNGFRRYWDRSARAPYLWNPHSRQFITYEDEKSIKKKCHYTKKKKLGGMMFWEFHDDYQNKLLKTIYKSLKWLLN
jgi:chitinase